MASITGPLASLVNNISGSIDNLVNDITGQGQDSDPDIPQRAYGKAYYAVTKRFQVGNWLKLVFPYTLSVVDILEPYAGPTRHPFTDFALPLAPSELVQSWSPAIVTKATQGGTTTTHSGMRYKIITLKGTTGINAFRGAGGVDVETGEAIFQPSSLKYRSGYEVFHLLENWLRSYYEYKKVEGKNASNMRLVFKNYKDGEFSIVDLMDFKMTRQASRSFLYDYEIEFKVIAQLNFEELDNDTTDFENALDTALALIDSARGVFLRAQDILRQIESTYNAVVLGPLRKIALALKALKGVEVVAADVKSSIVRNTVNAKDTLAILLGINSQFETAKIEGNLDPRLNSVTLPNDLEAAANSQETLALDALGEGLMTIPLSKYPQQTINDVLLDQQQAKALPRSFYSETITELTRIRKNAEDFFNLGSSNFDTIFGRTTTLSADFTKKPTQQELDILNAFNEATIGISLLLSTEDLFKSSFDTRIRDMVQRFDGQINLFANTAVKQIQFVKGDTLERLAQRELGNSSRWGEIVEVNNLKPPYISEDFSNKSDNIIKPGDTILIPIPLQNGFSQVIDISESDLTKNLSEFERSLGTDLKLTSDMDLALTRSGDIELVAGTNNMAQAVILKLGYEPGEVIKYPQLGVGIRPGVKFPNIEDIYDELVNSLLQDSRIQSIEDISIKRELGTLKLFFILKIKQVDLPIPISIQI